MKKLLFVRHGNATRQNGIYDDEADVFLSEKGKQQVERIKPFFTAFAADRVVSSNVIRCRQTTDILVSGNAQSPQIEYDERFRERAFPSLYNFTFEQIENLHGKEFSDLLKNEIEKAHIKGEESLEESFSRVVSAVKEHVSQTKERLAIISHGGPHSWLICHFLGLDHDSIRKFYIGEAKISLLEFADDGSQASIVSINAGDSPSFYAK